MKVLRCPHCPYAVRSDLSKRGAMGRLRGSIALHIKARHPEHFVPKVKPVPSSESTLDKVQSSDPGDWKPKRPYTRKFKSVLGVSFCPQCGCNINAVRVAMGL